MVHFVASLQCYYHNAIDKMSLSDFKANLRGQFKVSGFLLYTYFWTDNIISNHSFIGVPSNGTLFYLTIYLVFCFIVC